VSRSVLDRSAPAPDFTVAYGPEPDHIIDVRLPPTAGPAPLVIFLHGGFWRHEYDRAHVGPLATALARAGFVVATPEYRRTGAPGGGWPGTLDDVRVAVQAAPGLIGTGGEVILAGHSAGGQLALWAALWAGRGTPDPDRGASHSPVRGVVALAPVTDLRAAYELDLDGGAVLALLGGSPDEVPDRYAAADPLSRLPLGVPAVLVHGDQDRHVPVEFSRRYGAAAHAAGDPVRVVELPQTEHFAVIDPESAAWPDVVGAFRAV
jgi:acetyl esterase/lipase